MLQFQIIGDDRVLWDSGSIPEGEIKPFQVSLENVKLLKLLTLEGKDGGNYDWALWLEPTLSR
jgi:alpha-galactosidase